MDIGRIVEEIFVPDPLEAAIAGELTRRQLVARPMPNPADQEFPAERASHDVSGRR